MFIHRLTSGVPCIALPKLPIKQWMSILKCCEAFGCLQAVGLTSVQKQPIMGSYSA